MTEDTLTCGHPTCDETPPRGRKYCTDQHRDETRRLRDRVAVPATADDLATATIERKLLAADAAKQAAQRETRQAKTELRSAEDERDRALHELSLFDANLPAEPDWLQPSRKERRDHHGTLVSLLSDLHTGEVVNPAELGGYNKFDIRIAELRLERFFTRTIRVARNYLAGVTYDGIVLALGGDMESGDIHDELTETNEISTYEAVLLNSVLIERGIQMFADEFKRVHVVSAPGNHPRNSKKPRHKRRSANNADTLMAKLVAKRFEGVEGVTFDIPESTDVDFGIYDYTFSLEHGDNLKFQGTSEIGALGPVKRGSLRKTKKRQEQGRPVKYNLFGHFHQFVPAYTQGFVMNGSVKGYDEYASDGQFTPEPAQQALMVVTPEHGITVVAPVFVMDRDAEGW